ncbi:hypothetical protein YB2330_006354 [Saitoella coloradoensis]
MSCGRLQGPILQFGMLQNTQGDTRYNSAGRRFSASGIIKASSVTTSLTAVTTVFTPAPAVVAPSPVPAPPPPVTNHLTPAHLATLTSSTNLIKILQSSPELLKKLEEIALLNTEAGDGNATGSAGSVVEHPKRREALSIIAKVREDEVSGGKELMEMILKLVGIED